MPPGEPRKSLCWQLISIEHTREILNFIRTLNVLKMPIKLFWQLQKEPWVKRQSNQPLQERQLDRNQTSALQGRAEGHCRDRKPCSHPDKLHDTRSVWHMGAWAGYI